MSVNVAIAGATGAVGQEFLTVLAERNFPIKTLRLLASGRSAGKTVEFRGQTHTVEELTRDSFKDIQIAFFSAGGSISNQSSGTISGYFATYIGGTTGTIDSAGRIAGGEQGVRLNVAGVVINRSGGTISGNTAVYVANGAGTVFNLGTISGGTYAVRFDAGHAHILQIDPSAVFTGKVEGGNTIGGAIVSTLQLRSGTSAGTLTSPGTQFVHFGRISVDTAANWTLSGETLSAGYTLVDNGTLTNAGTLSSTVTVGVGALFSNASGGVVTVTSGNAVYGTSAGAATVVNAGRIAGNTTTGNGVYLKGGGRVTNQAGTISGRFAVRARPPLP